jgi:hypothetical protein
VTRFATAWRPPKQLPVVERRDPVALRSHGRSTRADRKRKLGHRRLIAATAARRIGADLLVSSRPKTIDTLVDKLRRRPNQQLNTVQDLAGVRIDADLVLGEQTDLAREIAAKLVADKAASQRNPPLSRSLAVTPGEHDVSCLAGSSSAPESGLITPKSIWPLGFVASLPSSWWTTSSRRPSVDLTVVVQVREAISAT